MNHLKSSTKEHSESPDPAAMPLEQTPTHQENKNASSNNAPLLSSTLFSPLDTFSMLLAALGHDLDHPGLPNAYYSKVWHLDPQIYSSKLISEEICKISVLERHHNKTLITMIEEFGLLDNLS